MGLDPGTNVMGYGVIRVVGSKAEMVALGVIDMHREKDLYLRYGHIFKRVNELINTFLPDEVAVEAQFFSVNIQSLLKLGRAQGIAIAAAINHDVPVHEYAPTKIKMAISGNGAASKEQVAGMLQRILKLDAKEMPKYYDATDALAVAYCHYMQSKNPLTGGQKIKSWKEFATKNKERVSKV